MRAFVPISDDRLLLRILTPQQKDLLADIRDFIIPEFFKNLDNT